MCFSYGLLKGSETTHLPVGTLQSGRFRMICGRRYPDTFQSEVQDADACNVLCKGQKIQSFVFSFHEHTAWCTATNLNVLQMEIYGTDRKTARCTPLTAGISQRVSIGHLAEKSARQSLMHSDRKIMKIPMSQFLLES